jgi:hypothetical protein
MSRVTYGVRSFLGNDGEIYPGTYIHSDPRHIHLTGGTFGAAAGTFPECATLDCVAGTFSSPPFQFNHGTFVPSM